MKETRCSHTNVKNKHCELFLEFYPVSESLSSSELIWITAQKIFLQENRETVKNSFHVHSREKSLPASHFGQRWLINTNVYFQNPTISL